MTLFLIEVSAMFIGEQSFLVEERNLHPFLELRYAGYGYHLACFESAEYLYFVLSGYRTDLDHPFVNRHIVLIDHPNVLVRAVPRYDRYRGDDEVVSVADVVGFSSRSGPAPSFRAALL